MTPVTIAGDTIVAEWGEEREIEGKKIRKQKEDREKERDRERDRERERERFNE